MRFALTYVVPTFLSLLLAFPGLPQQTATTAQRDPQALSILSQALDAAGGAQALGAIQDFTASGNITYFWAGDQVQGTVKVKGRSTTDFRVDANLPEGTRSWVATFGKGSLRNLDGSLAAIPSHSALNLGALTLPQLRLVAALNNASLSVQYSGASDFSGHQVYVIHVQQGPYSPSDPANLANHLTAMDFLIDGSSHQVLLTRDTAHPPDSATLDFPHEIQFSDYRLTNGCLVPYSATGKN